MKIYIAGKMNGVHDFNRTAFNLAEGYLRQKGHLVINPARHPLGLSVRYYMRHALDDIDECEALYFLDGWEGSPGANFEMEYAKMTEKIIFFNGFVI